MKEGLLILKGVLTQRLRTTALDEENDGDGNEEDGYDKKDKGGGGHNGGCLINEGVASHHLHSSYNLPAQRIE